MEIEAGDISSMTVNNSNDKKELSNKVTETPGTKSIKQTLYILLLFSYIFIGCFGYLFHRVFKIDNHSHLWISIIMVVVLPILLNTYSVFWHLNFEETRTPEENLAELEAEIQNEDAPKTIPVILFGLGLLLTRSKNKALARILVPYLITSLFFGTVMTQLINQLIFDHYNLGRMVIAEELSFMFLSLSFGLMVMSIYLSITMY